MSDDGGIEWLVAVVLMALAVLLLLTGCATDRYLSIEEDQKFKETCEGHKCYVIPEEVLVEMLQKQRGIGI